MRWVQGASAPEVTRCLRKNGVLYTGEDTGLTFSVNSDGSFKSSYSELPIWGEMKRVTLNGQVMVQIPKYYIKREIVDGYLYTWVSKKKRAGYRCAAIFLHPDGETENDYYYVGAYESTNDTPGMSVSGKKYSTEDMPYNEGWTLKQYREAAQAIGDGWGITSIAELGDLWQVLLPIEFGTREVQSVTPGICAIMDGPFDEYYDLDYRTGLTDNVPNLHGICKITDNSPEGSSYNYKKQAGLNCGANPFVWHGIENPYGCIEKWIDGLTFSNGICYVTNDRAEFKTDDISGYIQIDYSVATSTNYVQELGYDENVPYCQLPTAVIGTSDIYFCAYWHAPAKDGYQYAAFSCGGGDAGVWQIDASHTSTYSRGFTGSRLSYSPV